MDQFTVVIPTLNRCETLAHTIESCVANDDDALRILVSDNQSTDATRDVVEEYRRRDPRVEYIRSGERYGMGSHYEFALGHVTEGFVMLLGSDDGLFPDTLSRSRSMLTERSQTSALAGSLAIYPYQNFQHSGAGMMSIRTEQKIEVRKPGPWLQKVAQNVCAPYELPYPYVMSWVRASVLDRLRKQTGRLICGCIPDFYLCIAVSSHIDDYVYSRQPLGLLGISNSSTDGAICNPLGDRSIEKSFFEESDPPWHPDIPFVRSHDIIHAETFMRAREAGVISEKIEINWPRMIGMRYAQHP